jgi:hypothetical protein
LRESSTRPSHDPHPHRLKDLWQTGRVQNEFAHLGQFRTHPAGADKPCQQRHGIVRTQPGQLQSLRGRQGRRGWRGRGRRPAVPVAPTTAMIFLSVIGTA